MSAGLIERTGNLIVHHPVRVRTSSNEFTICEPLRQPGSAPTAAELDAMDAQQVSIEQEVNK